MSCIQNLPVVFALDRGGLVGSDGATHHGAFDLVYLRCLPNMMVMAASEENECRQMLYTAFKHDGPAAVRYPRGSRAGCCDRTGDERSCRSGAAKCGAARALRRVAALRFSRSDRWCRLHWRRPSNSMRRWQTCASSSRSTTSWWRKLARTHDALVTIEENVIAGGAGSACLESLAAQRIEVPVLRLGLPDRFIDHGDPAALLKECGLDAAGIAAAIRARFPELTRAVRVVQSAA